MFNSALMLFMTLTLVLGLPFDGNTSLGKTSLLDKLINVSIGPVEDKTRDLTVGQDKPRVKRQSEEECEKLELCMLHARSRHSFFYAFEQYFVNKENARLWDHHARSISECHRRFRSCYR